MYHLIRFVNDDELPPDQDWALVRTPSDYYFFIKRSRVTEEALMQGWEAYDGLAFGPHRGPDLRSA